MTVFLPRGEYYHAFIGIISFRCIKDFLVFACSLQSQIGQRFHVEKRQQWFFHIFFSQKILYQIMALGSWLVRIFDSHYVLIARWIFLIR